LLYFSYIESEKPVFLLNYLFCLLICLNNSNNNNNNIYITVNLRWAGHVARLGESRGAYRVLAGKPEGRRPLERPSHRWEDNIKMYLREVGWGDTDWINLAWDRDRWQAVVNAVMNLQVP
jgi:hypothetical protein